MVFSGFWPYSLLIIGLGVKFILITGLGDTAGYRVIAQGLTVWPNLY